MVQQCRHSKFSHWENVFFYPFCTNGLHVNTNLVVYAEESLTRAIISIFCILMRKLPLFLQKEKERLPSDSPFSSLIHHFWEVSFLLTFLSFTLCPHMFYIFAVHPVCSTSCSIHNYSSPNGLLCQLANWYVSCTFLAAQTSWVTSLNFLPSDKVS